MTFAMDTTAAVRPGNLRAERVVARADQLWVSHTRKSEKQRFFLSTNVEILTFEAHEAKILTLPGMADAFDAAFNDLERWEASL